MKRFLSVTLAILLLLSAIFTGCGEPTVTSTEGEATESEVAESTAEADPYADYVWEDIPEEDYSIIEADVATLEAAVQQVAWAMYNKDPYVQYEAHAVSGQSAGDYENIGVHHYYVPEFASEDQAFYMQCNSFCVNCIYDAFHYVSYGGQIRPGTNIMNAQAPEGTQVYYRPGVTEETAEQVIEEIRAIIRPGDIIAAKGESAHALLYIGDYKGDGVEYVAHCWGAGYEKSTGIRNAETNGAIFIQPADEVVFGHVEGYPNWDLRTHATAYVGIIRLINAPDFTGGITKSSQSRIKYPGISIDKTLDRAQYRGVANGEEVEVRISVTNNSSEAYQDLHIKDYVPRGTVYVSGDTDATLNVQPGETKTMAYKVKVIAKAGETVTFGKGFVDEIRTREIICNVTTANLSDEEVRKLNIYAANFEKQVKAEGDLSDIIKIYKEALGADVQLPETLEAFLPDCFEMVQSFIHRKETTDANKTYSAQVVYKQYGGMLFSYLPEVMNRNLDLMTQNYREGDVFITCSPDADMIPKNITLYLCLGAGKFLQMTKNASKIVDLDSTISLSFAAAFYFAIRPSTFATGLGKTEGVLTQKLVTTEAELDEAIKENVDEIVITENLTLTKKHTTGSKKFTYTVRAGKTLDLADINLSADSIRLEDGAHLVSSGSGRMQVVSYSKEATLSLVKQFNGEALSVYTNYYTSTNFYDCLAKTAEVQKGNAKLSSEDRTDYFYENLKEAAAATSEGWTIVLHDSFFDEIDVLFKDGVTVDLNGYTLAIRSIGKAHITITDSTPSGMFYIHGTAQGIAQVFEGSIDMPDKVLKIGYLNPNAARKTTVTFTGTITCKGVELSNGSSYTTAGEGKVDIVK